ncbi:MAG: T9SS type A sorting domain-containing protein, partial [Bacteroidia bacterium]
DNKLCGTTREGGSTNMGVIFNYSLATNIYTKVFDFNTAIGGYPTGGFISVTFTTGIPGIANAANGISVYPNPVNDLLKVQSNSIESKNVSLNLRDIFGKTIYSSSGKIIFSDQFAVDMKSCSSGLYFLEVIADGNSTITKVMKE